MRKIGSALEDSFIDFRREFRRLIGKRRRGGGRERERERERERAEGGKRI